jgi:hypothetical protein
MNLSDVYTHLMRCGYTRTQIEKFKAYHDHNPDIWREFETEALRLGNSGVKYYSADDIMHGVRLILQRETNNNFTAYYVRVFAFKHPQFKSMFKYRNVKQAA